MFTTCSIFILTFRVYNFFLGFEHQKICKPILKVYKKSHDYQDHQINRVIFSNSDLPVLSSSWLSCTEEDLSSGKRTLAGSGLACACRTRTQSSSSSEERRAGVMTRGDWASGTEEEPRVREWGDFHSSDRSWSMKINTCNQLV